MDDERPFGEGRGEDCLVRLRHAFQGRAQHVIVAWVEVGVFLPDYARPLLEPERVAFGRHDASSTRRSIVLINAIALGHLSGVS